MKSIEKRLSMLEGVHLSDVAIVEKWVRARRFYDELTDEEKRAYERYKESLGGCDSDLAAARLNEMFYKMDGEKGIDDTPPDQFYHFRLTKRKRPPTPEEHAKRVQEIQELFDSIAQEELQNEE